MDDVGGKKSSPETIQKFIALHTSTIRDGFLHDKRPKSHPIENGQHSPALDNYYDRLYRFLLASAVDSHQFFSDTFTRTSAV